MNRRPTEPAGKPFLRVPLRQAAKPKPKPKPATKPTAAEEAAIDRANREQARESIIPRAKGGMVMKKATKSGKAMVNKSADAKGRAMVKKYAKGGSIDGCATKGKTKTKMVKMAMGGSARMTGLNRAAAMSGRAMPTPGGMGRPSMMANPQNQGGPAMANFKRGGSCGMKKGK